MTKILIENEEGLPEIIYSDRMYIDPEAPTDILITESSGLFNVRVKFTDTAEADSFMDVLFEGDKINLLEIANDNTEMIVTIEEEEDLTNFYNALDEVLENYNNSDYEYGNHEQNGDNNE